MKDAELWVTNRESLAFSPGAVPTHPSKCNQYRGSVRTGQPGGLANSRQKGSLNLEWHKMPMASVSASKTDGVDAE